MQLRYPRKSHRSSFRVPAHSKALAEFCGIMLGDGGISAYQVMVTLGSNERAYGEHVRNLAQRLFDSPVSRYDRKNSNSFDLVLSRVGVGDFLVNCCGLVRGDKIRQQIDIPCWIAENTSYRIACMRGLFDTDGSVFTHRYLSKGKMYAYKKLGFTSASRPLLLSVHSLLNGVGLKVRFGSRLDVRIESTINVKRYFQLIGTNNPKHLKRYRSAVG